MTIQLSEEQKIKILNAEDVYRVMKEVLLREEKIDQEKEHFWMIGLAVSNMILYIELVSLGSASEVIVEPMNVYRVAVMKGAMKVIFVHNHPTGELNPSADDKDVTDRLIQVGRILNIEAIDHLIISTTGFLSFADKGIFAELKRSTKYVPQYELIERVKGEEKILREDAVKYAVMNEKKATVKKLKEAKAPLNLIMEVTGLTEEEIKGI